MLSTAIVDTIINVNQKIMKSFKPVYWFKSVVHWLNNLPISFSKICCVFALLMVCNTATSQQQYLNATINKTPTNASLTIHPESSVKLGTLKEDAVSLLDIPSGASGYVSFSFSSLNDADDITVSLENQDRSIYYEMTFVNGETMLADHQGTTMAIASSNARSNSLFKIRKCGNKVTWLENDIFPIISGQMTTSDELFAKVHINSADNIGLNVLFDITEDDCEKCNASNGHTLFPSDLMFSGYDNNINGNQIVLRNLVPIQPNTAFSLVQGSYHSADDVWYDVTGSNGQLNIHRIVYEGTTTIPTNSRICLILPTSGFGDDLLATSFMINGSPNNDFCVQNGGNTLNPQINLSLNSSSALFLVQGNWKLLDAHGQFSGRVLSGLQYGGDWTNNGNIAPSTNGLSNLPNDIECRAIEDGLTPATRHAYYDLPSTAMIDIANFNRWQTGSGSLPNSVCGTGSSLVDAQSRNSIIIPTKNLVQIYPNPFKNSFTIQLDLAKTQAVNLAIYDSSGRILIRQSFSELAIGQHQIPITFPNGVSDLIFWTRIQLTDEIIVKRLVKQGNGLN